VEDIKFSVNLYIEYSSKLEQLVLNEEISCATSSHEKKKKKTFDI